MRKYLILAAAISLACAGRVFKQRLPGPQSVAGGVLFQLDKPSAENVHVAGEFNSWTGPNSSNVSSSDPVNRPWSLTNVGDSGIWRGVIPLQPGRYKYKFIVDKTEWIADPNGESANDNDGNSLIVVGTGGTVQ